MKNNNKENYVNTSERWWTNAMITFTILWLFHSKYDTWIIADISIQNNTLWPQTKLLKSIIPLSKELLSILYDNKDVKCRWKNRKHELYSALTRSTNMNRRAYQPQQVSQDCRENGYIFNVGRKTSAWGNKTLLQLSYRFVRFANKYIQKAKLKLQLHVC